MTRPHLMLLIASGVGLISDVLPIPGYFAAALVFPQGIHSDYGLIFLGLALLLNFLLFFGITYAILRVVLPDRPTLD